MQTDIVEGMSHDLAATLDKYEINTVDRIAHFLAQVCVESEGFSVLVEEGDESYFQQYDGRNGNRLPGDGAKYKGRGLIQVTFRDNYERIGKVLALDLTNSPDLVLQPFTYLLVSCEFWKENNVNHACDGLEDDNFRVEAVTRIVNGPGLNHLKDRRDYFAKIKPLLVELASGGQNVVTPDPGLAPVAPPVKPPPSPISPPPAVSSPSLPVLDHGASGPAVKALETLLVAHGCLMNGTLTTAIQTAVKQFQQSHNLNPDGVVGPATWLKLLQDQ